MCREECGVERKFLKTAMAVEIIFYTRIKYKNENHNK